MKLLLDQNLSFRLLVLLEPAFPGSTQVARIGLDRADDARIWSFARDNGFHIVTKDSDFFERSLIHGFPPRVIWLKLGKASNRGVAAVLAGALASIRDFLLESDAACLEIYGP